MSGTNTNDQLACGEILENDLEIPCSEVDENEMIWAEIDELHPFTLLPKEIREIIFNKLEQPEACNLRLVCKDWNMEILTSYNFNILLNEDSPGLKFILQLRIARLQIQKLVQNRIRIFPAVESELEATETQKLTFQYPNRLERISIFPQSTMSANDLKDLLQLCKKTVVHLDLRLVLKISKYQFPSSIGFKFKNLKRLDLNFNFRHKYLCRRGSILTQFEISEFPTLQILNISFDNEDSRPNTSSAVGFVLKLLTRIKNPAKIIQLRIEFWFFGTEPDRETSEEFPQLSAPEVTSLQNITKFKQIQFSSLDSSEGSTSMDLLYLLIARQQQLETFKPGFEFEYTGSQLRTIALNNFETLVAVRIECLKANAEVPFDVSVFKSCPNLKELGLSNKELANVCLDPELINCSSFPGSLETLKLEGFRILTRDLLDLINSDLLLTLEKLTLNYCGDSGPCGLTSAALEKVVALETKKLQLVHLCEFNCSEAGEDVKISRLMKLFGNPGENADPNLWFVRDRNYGLVNREVLRARLREEGNMDSDGCKSCTGSNGHQLVSEDSNDDFF